MAINNLPKPTTTFNNLAKPTTTFVNSDKPSFTPLWSASVLPWQLSTPWLTFGEISNSAKPA